MQGEGSFFPNVIRQQGGGGAWHGICLFFIVFLLAQMGCAGARADALACLDSALVLPLLGGVGDAPIIPVRIGGQDAAMFVTPSFDKIYVRDAGALLFPPGKAVAAVRINGYHVEEASRISVGDLEIGDTKVQPVQAIHLSGVGRQTIAGRPIVGVLGNVAFADLQVLLDIPHGKIAFLTIRKDKDCVDAARELMGGAPYSVITNDDDEIPITIDGKRRWVFLDPDLNFTALPSDWDDLPELSADAVRKGELSVTHYGQFATAGRRLSLADFRIADVQVSDSSVVIQRDIEWGLIGLPFFESRIALFDFPHHRFYFMPSETVPRVAGHDLHFEAAVGGAVSVRERHGKLR